MYVHITSLPCKNFASPEVKGKVEKRSEKDYLYKTIQTVTKNKRNFLSRHIEMKFIKHRRKQQKRNEFRFEVKLV